jgi:hypothetical protein
VSVVVAASSIPTGFDSYVSEADPQTIDLHTYAATDNAEQVSHIMTLTPERAVELIQELALALESIPTHAFLGGVISGVVEAAAS